MDISDFLKMIDGYNWRQEIESDKDESLKYFFRTFLTILINKGSKRALRPEKIFKLKSELNIKKEVKEKDWNKEFNWLDGNKSSSTKG